LGHNLISSGSGIWIDAVVWVVHLTSKEIKERRLVSISIDGSFSSAFSFFFLFFVNFEIGVQKSESSNNEENEEINDFESKISLELKVFPLSCDIILFSSFSGRVGSDISNFFNFNNSSWSSNCSLSWYRPGCNWSSSNNSSSWSLNNFRMLNNTLWVSSFPLLLLYLCWINNSLSLNMLNFTFFLI
jgi:hypothetical protein